MSTKKTIPSIKEKVNCTYEELITLFNYIDWLLSKNTEETVAMSRIKLRIMPVVTKKVQEYNDLLDDKEIEHSLKGDKGEVLYYDGAKKRMVNEVEFKKAGKELRKQKITFDVLRCNWNTFTDKEKKSVETGDELTYNTMKLITNGLPEYKED